MDINENLTQVNTFIKGMDTDTSDMYLSNQSYRYAENVRITTDEESNSGELHLIEGTVNSHINIGGGEIIATDYIRNYGIYIVKNTLHEQEDDEGYPVWYVYRQNFNVQDDLYGSSQSCKRWFGPCTELIWTTGSTLEDIKKQITTVLRYESEENIKLYIADSTGKHTIMTLNVGGDDPYDQSLSFDDVFSYQKTLLKPLNVEISSGSGTIVSGRVQYAYRLYVENGATTPLSILSKPLSLYKNEYSGYKKEQVSGRSVNMSVPAVDDDKFNKLQIYRISYQVSGQVPKISLIKDEKITSNLIDDGSNIEEDFPLSEFLAMFTPFIYPKHIESKGDYLFAANITYQQDVVDDDFKDFDARSYSKGNYIIVDGIETNVLQPKSIDLPDMGAVGGYVTVTSYGITEEPFDTSDLKHHSFSQNSDSPVFNRQYWEPIEIYYDNPLSRLVGPIPLSCNGFGKYICWRYVYDVIPDQQPASHPLPTNQTGTYKSSNFTFRCGETYRFGIKLYNKYGQSSSVKWIADIMIPPGENIYQNTAGYAKIRNVGIEFFINPESLDNTSSRNVWEKISGFEIVRCERKLNDRKAVTQGIVGHSSRVKQWKVLNDSDDDWTSTSTNFLCPPKKFSMSTTTENFYAATYLLNNYAYKPYCEQDNNVYIFSSPEYCYQKDDISNILKSSDTIKAQFIYKCNCIENYNTYTTSNGSYNVNWHFYYRKPNYLNESVTNFTYWTTTGTEYNIKNIECVDSPKSEDFANGEDLTYKNNVTSIEGDQFINWYAYQLIPLPSGVERTVRVTFDNIENNVDGSQYIISSIWLSNISPIGSGARCMLLKFDNNTWQNFTNSSTSDITVINLNKSTIPYGGYNKTAIDNSEYISFGDYTDVDLSEDNNNITINCGVKVFSGDTKNTIFTFNALHNWYSSTYVFPRIGSVYAIPVESDIDIQAQYGVLYGVDGISDYRVQDYAGTVGDYTQDRDAYLYNTVYNATPDIVSWTTPEKLENKYDSFDTRIHYSNLKTNNELIDSWVQFAPANYIDVDSRFGEITDLKLFKDKLIFWQENATGILSVNERVVLNDQNDTQVVLGTGGVLERYDYFTTVYGQKKNQHVRAITNDSLYWWDGNNKEILLYQQKYDVTPLSSVKNIKNYINQNEESQVPFMVYDNKHKEVLMNVVNDKCIVYNESLQNFTGIYTFNPSFYLLNNADILLVGRDSNNLHDVYQYNCPNESQAELFEEDAKPLIKYIVNKDVRYNKVFDIQSIGGRFYGGSEVLDHNDNNTNKIKGECTNKPFEDLTFEYKTPLKQSSSATGSDVITNVEYDYKLAIPRSGNKDRGNRMRGKTMECTLSSKSNDLDFSLQYIITKYRMSWT